MLSSLKSRARALKTESYALYLAARDPRTPWVARGLVLFIVGYAISPIDLIPDFIPILGYLDDLIIVPAGIALALRMIPPQVMEESRERARVAPMDKTVGVIGTIVIISIWILAIILCIIFISNLLRKRL